MIAINLPELLGDVRWGDVPGWFSSIGTVGALGLGFYILLRDRRKEEEQQAAQVICWLDERLVDNLYDTDPFVECNAWAVNSSSQPVFNPILQATPLGRREVRKRWKKHPRQYQEAVWAAAVESGSHRDSLRFSPGRTADVLDPGDRAWGEFRFPPPAPYHLRIDFTDAQGKRWSRDLRVQSLRRAEPEIQPGFD